MKILHLISSGGCYGAEVVLTNLAGALENLGCQVRIGVFCNAHRPHTEVAEYARQRGLTVEVIPCGGKLDWKTVRRIRQYIDGHGFDIVHTHGYKADIYGYLSTRSSGVPLIATCHNWTCESMNVRIYGIVDRFMLRHFHRIVAVSEGVAEALVSAGVARGKVTVIGNGVDVPAFCAAEPKYAAEIGKGRRLAVGMVGRLVLEKGPQYLIEAAGDVIRDFPDTVFILIGDGPERLQFQQMTQSLGIEKHVIFAGYRDDMPEVLASLDVVALPSLREAMPMSVMEAMAAGRPVIGTRVGAIPTMIADGITGLLVDPGNPAQLREALARLLANAKLRRDLGKQAQVWAAKHFSLDAVALRYLGVYEELVYQERQVA